MAYKNPTVHQPSSAYNDARQKYGSLTYAEKMRVLDGVSRRTDQVQGSVAEQAFVDAFTEVASPPPNYFYLGGWPFT